MIVRHLVKQGMVLAVVVGAVVAVTRWPHLNQVETGRTPEYPDLLSRDYGATEIRVAGAAKAAVGALPGFRLVGGGSGRGGSEVQAEASGPLLPLRSELRIRMRREGSRTAVSVSSRSPGLPWDFGQNARHVRAFLAELDRQMFRP